MGSATLSVEEYLRSSYSPDREYLDGAIVERHLGEKTHGRTQRGLITYIDSRAQRLGIEVIPEQRVQVSATRFRIPDVIVATLPQPDEEIVSTPPHLCIEVLSKDDTMNDMQERIDDYLDFGVPYVWIVNPWKRKGYVVTRAGLVEAKSGILETHNPDITLPLNELFGE
ncbi:MAG TPA: Uma2 family endonuclease [Bryobacteraceae bacterium]|nr:Uma2 family endonuclease [Bryobacteraceae bacterium]